MAEKLMIGGIDVKFPFTPYSSQLSMMSMIIRGIKNQQNCLLESPTGSGKTLALLCSSLAWQDHFRKSISSDDQAPYKVPKIFFGTRTHRQITQVVAELKSTYFKNVNICILSSREHSCINPVNISSKSSKNEGCKKLLKGTHPDAPEEVCKYVSKVKRINSHISLSVCGLDGAWDLEDLVKLGKKKTFCPYFVSKNLLSTADIVFCPYNYLIDPLIRESMKIDIEDQILIFDEGHNVEDVSRSSSSFELNQNDLESTIDDLQRLVSLKYKIQSIESLLALTLKIGDWLQTAEKQLVETGFETFSKNWDGKDFISVFTEWGVTKETLSSLTRHLSHCLEEEDSEENDNLSLNAGSKFVLEGLFLIFRIFLENEHQYFDDYQVCYMKTIEFGIPRPKKEGWITIHNRPQKHQVLNLCFWCLNPAVSFEEFKKSRCLIITSGTLSPLSSFTSELDIQFQIRLEAFKTIPNSQMWVGAIGFSPNNHELKATYQNVNSLKFQEELGLSILSICKVTPKGVLCFVPSYKLLEELCKRWKTSGLWQNIGESKEIFCEGKNKSSFDEIIKSYYKVNSGDGFGGLLLAVYRGKISEGVDFSDDNARAVITVGIPFPSYKDKKIQLKIEYNDRNKSRGLLSGREWYEIQAYRALNQALGRCIRHTKDWGALIIIDARFTSNPQKHCGHLSNWIRKKLVIHHNCNAVHSSLKSFFENETIMKLKDKKLSKDSLLSKTFDSSISLLSDGEDFQTPKKNQLTPDDITLVPESSPEPTDECCKRKLSEKENETFSKKKKYSKSLVCHQKLNNLTKFRHSFHHINKLYGENIKLMICNDSKWKKILTLQSVTEKEIKIDSSWCEHDKLAYQFHSCPNCSNIVGFCIKNHHKYNDDKLFLFSSYVKH